MVRKTERNIIIGIFLVIALVGFFIASGLFSIFSGNQFYAQVCSGTSQGYNVGPGILNFLDYQVNIPGYIEVLKNGNRIFYSASLPTSYSLRQHACIKYDGSTLISATTSQNPCDSDTTIDIAYYKQTGSSVSMNIAEVWYNFKSTDLDFQYIQQPQPYYFKGENITVSYKIISNIDGQLNAVLSIRACTPAFFTPYCQDFAKSITLVKGDNVYSLEIPANVVSSELTLQPIVSIVAPNFYQGASVCTANYLGTQTLFAYSGNVTRALVIPQPLYLAKTGACPANYHASPNDLYCISDELSTLGCMQLGCPVSLGHMYSCVSTGNCAEIVYVYQDCRTTACTPVDSVAGTCNQNNGNCEYIFRQNITCASQPSICASGYACNLTSNACEKTITIDYTCRNKPELCSAGMTCDAESGACIKTELITEIAQCKVVTDCFKPCSGVATTCNRGICEYSGACQPTVIGCKELKCSAGDTCNQETNVCERTITIVTIPLSAYASASVLGAIVIVLLIIVVRRKR